MPNRFVAASDKIRSLVEAEVTPVLEDALQEALARFPKAKKISIFDSMGVVWFDIDNHSFYFDYDDDPASFEVSYKNGTARERRVLRAHRLQELVEVILECQDFLDEFNVGFPEITVTQ